MCPYPDVALIPVTGRLNYTVTFYDISLTLRSIAASFGYITLAGNQNEECDVVWHYRHFVSCTPHIFTSEAMVFHDRAK